MAISILAISVSVGCSKKGLSSKNRVSVPIAGTSYSLSLPPSYMVFVDTGERPNHRYALCPNTVYFEPDEVDIPKLFIGLGFRVGSFDQYNCIVGKGSSVDNRTRWSSLPHNKLGPETGFLVESYAEWVLIIDYDKKLVSMVMAFASGDPLAADASNEDVCYELYKKVIVDN